MKLIIVAAMLLCAFAHGHADAADGVCTKYQHHCEQQAAAQDKHVRFRQTYHAHRERMEAGEETTPLTTYTKEAKALRVGVYYFPPYVILSKNGEMGEIQVQEGFSVDVWEQIANATNTKFEYVYVPKADAKRVLEDGDVDMVASGMIVTTERMNQFQFSVPFWFAGLNAMVLVEPPDPFVQLLGQLTILGILKFVGMLLLVLLSSGTVFYLLERKRMADEKVPITSVPEGVLQGMWWSAATLTTVGYGDQLPKTSCGKVFGLLWVVISLFIFAAINGSVSAGITANSLQSTIHGVNSLDGFRVGAIENSFAMTFLTEHYTRTAPSSGATDATGEPLDSKTARTVITSYRSYANLEQAVINGDIDAAIGVDSTLKYVATQTENSALLAMAGMPTHHHGVAFAFNNAIDPKFVELVSGYIVKPGLLDPLVAKYFGG